jgi:putative membrane protein
MGWWMWWMPFGWVLGLAVLILLFWMIARTTDGFAGRAEDSPEQILKRRYARGEIDRDEFERRLTDLRR